MCQRLAESACRQRGARGLGKLLSVRLLPASWCWDGRCWDAGAGGRLVLGRKVLGRWSWWVAGAGTEGVGTAGVGWEGAVVKFRKSFVYL